MLLTVFKVKEANIYNTLASIAGIGQKSQEQTSNLAQNTAGNIGQATIGIGNALAGGQVGAANAYSNAIQGAGNSYTLCNWLSSQGGATNKLWNASACQVMATPTTFQDSPSRWAGVTFTWQDKDKKWQIFQSILLHKL
jgi:hypothetical protein